MLSTDTVISGILRLAGYGVIELGSQPLLFRSAGSGLEIAPTASVTWTSGEILLAESGQYLVVEAITTCPQSTCTPLAVRANPDLRGLKFTVDAVSRRRRSLPPTGPLPHPISPCLRPHSVGGPPRLVGSGSAEVLLNLQADLHVFGNGSATSGKSLTSMTRPKIDNHSVGLNVPSHLRCLTVCFLFSFTVSCILFRSFVIHHLPLGADSPAVVSHACCFIFSSQCRSVASAPVETLPNLRIQDVRIERGPAGQIRLREGGVLLLEDISVVLQNPSARIPLAIMEDPGTQLIFAGQTFPSDASDSPWAVPGENITESQSESFRSLPACLPTSAPP